MTGQLPLNAVFNEKDMKKIYIVSILLVVLCIVAIFLFLRDDRTDISPAPVDTLGPTNPLPPQTPSYINESDNKRVLVGIEGEEYAVDDFLRNNQNTPLGEGLFEIQTNTVSGEPVYFQMIFNEADSSFAIALLERPLALARQLASQEIKELLMLSEEELCQLNIFVSVPFSIDSNVSGTDLGLSYCADAIPLRLSFDRN